MEREKNERADVIQKIKELNRKITELKRNIPGDALLTVRNELRKSGADRVFSLDYIESDNLLEVETGINETMEGLILSKEALCKALSNIDKKRLYRQVGADNFMQYLYMERIPLNYKTAKEYAKIGNTLIRYSDELTSVEFREEDGLKKLIFVDAALENTSTEARDEVFQRVKENSLREFQRWVREQKPDIREEEQNTTVDESGAPVAVFSIEDSAIIRKTSAGNPVKAVIVNLDAMGIVKEDSSFSEFMEKLLGLTQSFYTTGRKTHHHEKDTDPRAR